MSERAILRAELDADPLGIGYAGMTDAEAAEALNAPRSIVMAPGSYLAEGGILRVLGPSDGDAVLAAIEAVADAEGHPLSRLMGRIVRILRDTAGGGIDFGDAATHAMLDQLEAAGVLDPAHVAALKAHGTRSLSRAGELGLGFVGEQHVTRARLEDN